MLYSEDRRVETRVITIISSNLSQEMRAIGQPELKEQQQAGQEEYGVKEKQAKQQEVTGYPILVLRLLRSIYINKEINSVFSIA